MELRAWKLDRREAGLEGEHGSARVRSGEAGPHEITGRRGPRQVEHAGYPGNEPDAVGGRPGFTLPSEPGSRQRPDLDRASRQRDVLRGRKPELMRVGWPGGEGKGNADEVECTVHTRALRSGAAVG